MRKSELIDLFILEILGKRAGRDHKMTQAQLMHYLEEDYEVMVTRNTVSKYLKELRERGYIAGERGFYRVNLFDDNELRLLIDGVLFGQHIPKDNAKILIDKLKAQSEIGLKNRMRSVYYLEGIQRTKNDKIYQMIDIIDEAIQNEKQIRVTQCRYNKNLKLEKTDRQFVIDPYYLVTEKSRYYLICFVEDFETEYHGKGLENLRVDRFYEIEPLNTPRRPMRKVPGYENRSFLLDEYMREHIYMWSGETGRVTLKIKTRNIGDFIDWFGDQFMVMQKDDDYMKVSMTVNFNAIKYWALQYGSMATVLSPSKLRNSIKEALANMQAQYQD